MIDIDIDVNSFNMLRSTWPKKHRHALKSALKGEAYRLKSVTQQTLRAGIGPPKAPLTVRESYVRGDSALKFLARQVAYEVKDYGFDGLEVVVGPGVWFRGGPKKTGKKRPIPVKMIKEVVGGASRSITRADQRKIAAKLRKKYKKIQPGWIPKIGHVINFPLRDYVSDIVGREKRHSQYFISKLYALKMKGQRWGRGKWWEKLD